MSDASANTLILLLVLLSLGFTWWLFRFRYGSAKAKPKATTKKTVEAPDSSGTSTTSEPSMSSVKSKVATSTYRLTGFLKNHLMKYALPILVVIALTGSFFYFKSIPIAIVEISFLFFAIAYLLGGLEVYKDKVTKYTKMIFYTLTTMMMVSGVLIIIFGIDLASQFFNQTINGVRGWAYNLLNAPEYAPNSTYPDDSSWLLYGGLGILVVAVLFSGSEKKK